MRPKHPSYDVVVVGAGPAGSTLALQLARRGRSVAILERQAFPRTKVCGEYLSIAALHALRDLGMEGCVADAHRINGIALTAFGSEPLRLRLPESGARALARADFDQRLLQCALAAGAELERGGYMSDELDGDEQHITYRDEHGQARVLRARVLVGADGAWSSVAVRNGMAPTARRGGRWAVGGHLVGQPYSDELEMYVGAGGYYARNPLSADSSNAMLVLPHPARAHETDEIVNRLTGGRRRFDEGSLQRRVAVGPLRYAPHRIMTHRILLTGDAAGLLDPFTGQGVACALRLSLAAANAVTALLDGEPSTRVNRRYHAEWRSVVAPRRALSWLIDRMLRAPFLRARAQRAVVRDATIAERMLAAVSGSAPPSSAFSPRLLWQLLA